MSRRRRPLAVLAALLVSVGLAACGNHPDEDAPIKRLEGEGFYLSLGELKYQVQGSRQLNRADQQDRALLVGVPEDERGLERDEVWFAVFVQVENESGEALRPSDEIKVVDTQEREFEPVDLDDDNPFEYRPSEPIPPGRILPLRDTPGFDSSVRGALLLFKLDLAALDNRPLELEIDGRHVDQVGIIDLDV